MATVGLDQLEAPSLGGGRERAEGDQEGDVERRGERCLKVLDMAKKKSVGDAPTPTGESLEELWQLAN